MLVKKQIKILAIQRLVIIVLVIALIVTVIRIWKYEGKGASEWYTEYKMTKWELERIVRCVHDYDSEPFYKRQEGVHNYCKL